MSRVVVAVSVIVVQIFLGGTGCATTSTAIHRVTSEQRAITRRPPPPGVAPAIEPLRFVDDGRFAYVDGVTGKALDFADVVARVKAHRVVVVGEQHDQPQHHEAQRRVIAACGQAGPGLVVGLEMLTWDTQPTLDGLNRGELDIFAFAAAVDWKTAWGFDFALYAPLFSTGREVGARFVALNAPKDLVRALRKDGIEGLSADDAARLPELDLGDALHRRWFEGIFRSAGHPLKGEEVDGFYRAQVLWDEAMADRTVAALQDGARQVVVVAGAGHVAAGRGIPQRVERRLDGERVLTIVPMTVDAGSVDAALRAAIENAEADILVIPRFEAEIFL
jgi:uncharacterized iron-regulated protein